MKTKKKTYDFTKDLRILFYKLFYLFGFIPVLLLMVTACSSDDDALPPVEEPEEAVCRIVTMNVKSGNDPTSVFSISYNNDGKISEVNGPDTKYTWTYAGSGFTHSVFNDNNQRTRSSLVELNAQERPAKITENRYDPNTQIINETIVHTFVYNSAGELTEINSDDGVDVTPQTMSWSGGNMVQHTYDLGDPSELEYYTNRPIQQGDYFRIFYTIEQGTPSFFNQNLIKSISGSNSSNNFNYEFDEDGKIEKFILSSSGSADTVEASYLYECEEP